MIRALVFLLIDSIKNGGITHEDSKLVVGNFINEVNQ